MAEADTSRPAGIGARLRAGRERLGLTLLQAAEKLHLAPDAVDALEQERFDELGAAVFVRGHIRRYAELVHESVPQLLDQLTEAARALPAPDLRRMPRVADPDVRPASALLLPGVAVFAGVGLVGIIWWGAHGFSGQPGAHLAPAQAQPLAAAAEISAPASTPETANSVAAVRSRPAGTPASLRSMPRPGPAGSVAPAPQAAGLTELTLRFNGDSWAEVYDAHGDKLLYDLVSAASERSIRALAPLRVVLGNAAAVTLAVDGRAIALPGHTLPGHALQFLLDRAGRAQRVRLPAAAPAGPAAAAAPHPADATVQPAAAVGPATPVAVAKP